MSQGLKNFNSVIHSIYLQLNFYASLKQNRRKTYLRVVVTVNLLKTGDKLPGMLVEALEAL